ncbi:MAG: hypothetical protein HYU99_05870 [Deltaproteobacteria bacterium]|nr:hypothetical protein [Deltaproteobacteria bacterium]
MDIPEHYQSVVQSYNHVDDPYLCYGEYGGDDCEVKVGQRVASVKADPRNDQESMHLLKEISGWVTTSKQRKLLKPYIVQLWRDTGNPYTRLCTHQRICPRDTPQPDRYPYYNEWAEKMSEFYGIAPPLFSYRTVVAYVPWLAPGEEPIGGFMSNGDGIPEIVVFPGAIFAFGIRSIRNLQQSELGNEKEKTDPTGIHELAHAYLSARGGSRYVPSWLKELLAYSLADPEFKLEPSREFYEILSTLPIKQVLGIDQQTNNSIDARDVAFMMRDLLLEADSAGIKKIGHEIFGANFENMSEEERKRFWLSVLKNKLNITAEQLVAFVKKRIQEELSTKG